MILVEPGGFKTGIWEELERDVESHAGSRYEPAYRRTLWLTRAAQLFMGHPARVARVIGHAMTTRVPRARYLVGTDAQALAVANRFAPQPVKDFVSRITLGL